MTLREAYDRTIAFLRTRRQAYQLAFGSPAGKAVLSDLARFCRANETCFHPDERLHAVAEGRREVFLRIQRHLNLNTQQLFDLYAPGQATPHGE